VRRAAAASRFAVMLPRALSVLQLSSKTIGRSRLVDALIVIDMQVGLLNGAPKHDLRGVVDRINALAEKVRREGGKVIWIRHCGRDGDAFERHTAGWELLPELTRCDDDLVVEKNLNDPYVGTMLGETLVRMRPRRVLVAGWATDFCVDATVRSTVSHGHHVVAVSDGHTVCDRPHLPAAGVIAHHNWLWSGLLTNHSVSVTATGELLAESLVSEGVRSTLDQ
jgi:nicotinamidase-related amidase